MKGETVEEIAGAAEVMREMSVKIPSRAAEFSGPVVDTCGTGGDGSGTFNVSTTAAFVVAGAGVKVAKHGNRAVSSLSGSADLIEALGVSLDLTTKQVGRCLDEVGIAFLYAPHFHPAMRHALGPRRDIGLRTIFNLLGPLTNPAGATAQVVGVYSAHLVRPVAEVLRLLGCRSAFVAHGKGGYDELTVTGPTIVCRLKDGRVTDMTVTPEDMGLARASAHEIKGGDSDRNRAITLDVLRGRPGPCRDMTLMNSAAALKAAGRVADLREGVDLAADSIDSGAALSKLETLALETRRLAGGEG